MTVTSSSSRWRFVVLLPLVWLCTPAAAFAQGNQEAAEALIQEGLDQRRQGNDEAAIARFMRALELHESPRAYAQVALAAQALGRWLQADEFMAKALESPDDTWIQRNRGPLESAIATINEHVGSLDVRTEVAGAEIRINGELMGEAPLERPLRALAGRATLEVRAEGFYPVSRNIEIMAGSLTRETIVLRERPADDPGSGEGGGGGAGVGGARGRPVPSGDGTLVGLGWVGVGLGVAGLGLGVVGYLLRESAASDWNDDAVCLAGGRTREENCGDKRDSAETWQTLSTIGLVAGGAFAIGGIALIIAGSGGSSTEQVSALPCGPGPGELGVSCGGTF